MRIVRGTVEGVERDRRVTEALPTLVTSTGEPHLRVWTPPRQVAFGRRDAAAAGYDDARDAAIDRGYEPIERAVGGRAVAYTGATLAFVYGAPVDDERGGIGDRYDDATARLSAALRSLGATVNRGEPSAAFCPGDHSLQADGKVAGLAQRIASGCAVVGGCVVVAERDERALAAVLGPVYRALDVPFDQSSVGSVEGAGGPGDPARVLEAVEAAFLDGREAAVVAAASVLADHTA